MTRTYGERLAGYRILGLLGRGAMGEVYRALDLALGRKVAIKVLLDEVAADVERMARFEQEARALAQLSHPNVATFGFEVDGATRFLVMELIEGQTLAELLTKHSRLPVELLIQIAEQIARGLAHAHGRDVVHRDLKPANVVIGPEGLVKILDFGIAKRPARVSPAATGRRPHPPRS